MTKTSLCVSPNKGQEGTCAQDLQQLLKHISLQFGACNGSSAPEVPATAASSYSLIVVGHC